MKYKEFKQLSAEQIEELRQRYLSEKRDNVSALELANAKEIVSDKELYDEYCTTLFTDDDFFCTAGGA